MYLVACWSPSIKVCLCISRYILLWLFVVLCLFVCLFTCVFASLLRTQMTVDCSYCVRVVIHMRDCSLACLFTCARCLCFPKRRAPPPSGPHLYHHAEGCTWFISMMSVSQPHHLRSSRFIHIGLESFLSAKINFRLGLSSSTLDGFLDAS